MVKSYFSFICSLKLFAKHNLKCIFNKGENNKAPFRKQELTTCTRLSEIFQLYKSNF